MSHCGCGKCKKCRECTPIHAEIGCVKPCPEVCSETYDSRCVIYHCDIQSTRFFVTINNNPQQIDIPGCISQFELNQYLMLLQTNPGCIVTGNASRSVTYFYVEKINSNHVKVHFNGIDTSYINPIYVVSGYDIVVKNIQNSVIFTIPQAVTATNVYEVTLGSPVIIPGYTYEIHIVTKTVNAINQSQTASCNSLKHVIQM